MELWIRSQDRLTLRKIEHISYSEWKNEHIIYADFDKIAIYKSRKRALEVLNEIHRRLINLETLKIAPDSYKVLPKDTSNVYEMPKE